MGRYRQLHSQTYNTLAPQNDDRVVASLGLLFYGVVTSVLLATALMGRSAMASEYRAVEQNGITVRCNTVNSQFLPEASLEKYQLQADDKRGLLSCVVQREDEQGHLVNIPASVNAQVENFYGVTSEVEMRELSIDEQSFDVSYIGGYDVLSRHELTFTIQVTPQGSNSPIVLTMTDEDPAK